MNQNLIPPVVIQVLTFYVAVFGLFFFLLSVRTIARRRKLNIAVGDQSNKEMLRFMRAHANFAEYVPLTLLLIFFCALNGLDILYIHALCLVLLVGRVLHAYGITQNEEPLVFRVTGMVFTFTSLLGSVTTAFLFSLLRAF